MQKNNIILIGHGSIGKSYAKELIKKNNFNLYIFDKEIHKQEFSYKEKIIAIKSINDLKKILLSNNFLFGIIATWSDSHLYYLDLLSHNKIKKILIEKPISNSIDNFFKISELIISRKIKISTNYRWSILEIHKKIIDISNKYQLGRIINFTSIGGAFCLSTGGYHLFDLINNLHSNNFKKFEVISNINFSNINPRNKKFSVLEGSISIFLNKKLIANFIYSNSSYMAPYQLIMFKNAIMILKLNGDYEIFSNKKRDVLSNLPITRYFQFDKKIAKGKMFSKKTNITRLALENFFNPKKRIDNDRLFAPQLILFGSLLSNYYKKLFRVISVGKESMKIKKKKWPIT